MNKIVFLALCFLITISLVSCKQVETKAKEGNTLKVADLSTRENAILSTTVDNSAIFDFNVDNKKDKQLSIWVEKYEFGKLVNDKIGATTTEIKGNGTIVLGVSTVENHQEQLLFQIGAESNGATSSSRTIDSISKDTLEDMSYVMGTNQSETLQGKEEIILSSFVISNANNGVESLSAEFYEDVDKQFEILKEYDVVYLLKGKFH